MQEVVGSSPIIFTIKVTSFIILDNRGFLLHLINHTNMLIIQNKALKQLIYVVSIIHIILRILLPQFNNLFEYNSNKAYLLIYILEIMIITLILLIREKKIFNIANVNIGFNKIFLQFLTFSSSQLVIFILTIF